MEKLSIPPLSIRGNGQSFQHMLGNLDIPLQKKDVRPTIDGSLPGSFVPGILQARVLEWVAISFSNAWKWKVKVKSLSRPDS